MLCNFEKRAAAALGDASSNWR